RSFFGFDGFIRSPGRYPLSELVVSLDRSVKISNGFVCLFVFWIILQDGLIGVDGFLGFRNILRSLHSWAILGVNRSGNEHWRSLVVRVNFRCFTRMLFRLLELTFA